MNSVNALFGGSGVDTLFGASGNPNEYDLMASLDDIEIGSQDREEFEDENNQLADLGRSLRDNQLQPIILRANRPGSDKPFLLVAGERRCRAARIEGLTHLWARVKELTDEQAEIAQVVENIHRKNLTQIEEAKRIGRDLKSMTMDAVMKKYNISRTRLSKMMGLLSLPEQARRLVVEDLSADVEAINQLKVVEKIDPTIAKSVIDQIKSDGPKANVRELIKKAKDKVKPPKVKEDKKPATQVEIFAGGKTDNAGDDFEQSPDNTPSRESVGLVLSLAYSAIFLQNRTAKSVLDDMSEDDRDMIEVWLHAFYDKGVQSGDAGRDMLVFLRGDLFAADGVGAFALAAFAYGLDRESKFSLLNIFGSVRA
ncbi:ParB/RepB/Spo0J family partition protein [Methylomonas methanica]|uniref:ParB-like N-terminal domain-containing protein n=1 Tax=Methylomonas methanica TaxID=421 RepID=A0A177MGG7_METMH|nr:ParB/RepB/Spo0J family partition protein [Methylomonas methanica]OAI04897.1 hypothetical protein A1332_13810 [Methylomonas methanica]